MSSNEYQRANKYAGSAIDMMRQHHVPPYPQFFELLYTYASGVNPHLNSRIDLLLQNDDGTTDVAERLYQEFLKTSDVEERLNHLSEKVFSKIDSVRGAVKKAMSSAESYSGKLVEANEHLTDEIDPNALRALTAQLLEETKVMQSNNRVLEERLQSSKTDIAALQRDLDAVRRESQLDPLTKIYNRKFFDRSIDKAVADAVDTGKPVSIFLLDIDYFKRFNDTFGHQTGDQVLRLVALTLKSMIKGLDIAARYGGEEFAAILPNTSLKGATALAEMVRKAIQSKELLRRSTNEKLGRVTASFGVAEFSPSDNAVSLIERADLCLYAAKRNGRNQVIDEKSDLVADTRAA
ncbi:MAG: GGDEF domain-containing protein [Alphaproteobacteria bacterium]|nr:GGDEF domain-containing protein [Alphaproteobacteria bacterium]